MKIYLHNLYHQYFIGLMVSISFALILYICPASHANTQVPVGNYQNNIWNGSDVMGYVGPGINYVHYGVFGDRYQPDHLRSVGYPAIISFFYWMFGKHWLLALQLLQCVLFALLYPINTLISRQLFPDISSRTVSAIFLFLLISGTYFIRSTMVLTDTFFVLFFNLGFYLGLKTFETQGTAFLLGYVLCITIAGLIRPMLVMFPIVNLVIAFFVARRNGLSLQLLWRQLAFTSLLFAFTCNLATVRNYINYSFLSPGSFAWGVYLKQMTCKVLMGMHKPEQYQAYLQEVESIKDITKKSELSKSIMEKTMLQYPVMTAKVLFANAINTCLDNHIVNNTANYFGYNWKTYSNTSGLQYSPANPYSQNSTYPYKKSWLCYYATYALMGVYFALWLVLVFFFYTFLRSGKYEYGILVALLFVVLMVPGIFNGNSGSRYRLPFEPFLTIFSIYQLSQIHVTQAIRLYANYVAQLWKQWSPQWYFGFHHPVAKSKL